MVRNGSDLQRDPYMACNILPRQPDAYTVIPVIPLFNTTTPAMSASILSSSVRPGGSLNPAAANQAAAHAAALLAGAKANPAAGMHLTPQQLLLSQTQQALLKPAANAPRTTNPLLRK